MPLPESVKTAAFDCLFDLYPQWRVHPLIDQQRSIRPQGQGSATIHIESYRGASTVGSFYRIMDRSAPVMQLTEALKKSAPALLGYMVTPGSVSLMQVERLIVGWLKYIEDHHSTKDLPNAIAETISDFSEILDNQFVVGRANTALSGLSLPEGITSIQLDNDILLRNLTTKEITEMGSHDIFSSSTHDFLGNAVTTCIEKVVNIPLKFSLEPDHSLMERENIDEKTAYLMLALHILKPGRANPFLSSIYVDKSPINWGGSATSSYPHQNPHASFILEQAEIEELLAIYKAIKGCKRSEVMIAASRLMDSEHRFSPVDALLDSVIGLEVILNPNDFGEASFRVALNYAYLGPARLRRKRYESLKSVQATRNKVVHGGLNLGSLNAQLIHEHADIGKSCLRDSLKKFLFDASLKDGSKLTAGFWLDRILPPDEIR